MNQQNNRTTLRCLSTYGLILLLLILISCNRPDPTPGEVKERIPNTILEQVSFTVYQQGEKSLLVEAKESTQWNGEDLVEMKGVSFYDFGSSHQSQGTSDFGTYNPDEERFYLNGNVLIDSNTSNVHYWGNSFTLDNQQKLINSDFDDTVNLRVDESLQVQGKAFEANTEGTYFSYTNGAVATFITNDDTPFTLTANTLQRTRTDGAVLIELIGKASIVGDDITITSEYITITDNSPTIITTSATTILVNQPEDTFQITSENMIYKGSSGILTSEGWVETLFQSDGIFIESSYMKSDLNQNIMTYQVGSHMIVPDNNIETFADSTVLYLDASRIQLQGNVQILEENNEYNAEQAYINLNTSEINLWVSSGGLTIESSAQEEPQEEGENP